MNKWHLRFLRLAYFGLAAILPAYALADYAATQGAGTIFRAFDATHGGSALCAAANTQCQAIGLVNSAGAEIGTAGAPVRFDPTGTTTQPVSPGTAAAWGIGTSTYNSALATNGQLALGQFQTAPGAITTTNMAPLQVDSVGNLRVNVMAGGAGGGSVTQGTSPWVDNITQWASTALAVPTAWGTPPSGNVIGANVNIAAGLNNNGRATAAMSAPVVAASIPYQAVAASATATVLQTSTGATGDYLSHCVLYPTSTSPGVVTVFDNTNTAPNSVILFPGGASSLSNLAPIALPVGSVSKNGAWKVTTGASVSVVCYGNFS